MTSEAAAVAAEPVRRDVGRLEYLDPHELVIDPFNHRKKRRSGDDTRPDRKLVASVKAMGVQVPLLVRPQADGATLGVIWGQRRLGAALLAAAEAKAKKQPYTLVPCLVRDDLTGADDEALVASMVENVHRVAASERDDVEALTQLALMDLDDGKRERHAKALGYRPAEIRMANRAAKLSDEDLSSVIAATFDLVEAADYAEVSDVPGALDALSRAKELDREQGKRRGHWAHALQRLRQAKADAAKRGTAESELTAAGVRVVAYRYSWTYGDARPLTDLRTALDNPITAEHHAADCPGHAAALHPETHEPVYLCLAWQKHRHQLSTQAAPAGNGQTVDRAAEAAKRRRTIAYNKAWRAAREVRFAFITELCGRKSASDAAWTVVLSLISGVGYVYSHFAGRHRTDLTARFLGVPDPQAERGSSDPFGPLIARTGKARRWRLLLAHTAAAIESEVMHDHAWRSPGDELRSWLRFLATEGYTLSDIEQEMCCGMSETAPASAPTAEETAAGS
ncbi:ParB/RepB/Spo0J family partition protein [Streptomyces sp. 8K308]|uniref:ParB/RepB/Spo0J family partition protein n=1 Tax=Streptomyces sp. 8K308 TaxID=2530388 RepID=UPI0014048990|nr:ParB/RepB/Spo0J family partition protein [Streptomyces sp. 8K308]